MVNRRSNENEAQVEQERLVSAVDSLDLSDISGPANEELGALSQDDITQEQKTALRGLGRQALELKDHLDKLDGLEDSPAAAKEWVEGVVEIIERVHAHDQVLHQAASEEQVFWSKLYRDFRQHVSDVLGVTAKQIPAVLGEPVSADGEPRLSEVATGGAVAQINDFLDNFHRERAAYFGADHGVEAPEGYSKELAGKSLDELAEELEHVLNGEGPEAYIDKAEVVAKLQSVRERLARLEEAAEDEDSSNGEIFQLVGELSDELNGSAGSGIDSVRAVTSNISVSSSSLDQFKIGQIQGKVEAVFEALVERAQAVQETALAEVGATVALDEGSAHAASTQELADAMREVATAVSDSAKEVAQREAAREKADEVSRAEQLKVQQEILDDQKQHNEKQVLREEQRDKDRKDKAEADKLAREQKEADAKAAEDAEKATKDAAALAERKEEKRKQNNLEEVAEKSRAISPEFSHHLDSAATAEDISFVAGDNVIEVGGYRVTAERAPNPRTNDPANLDFTLKVEDASIDEGEGPSLTIKLTSQEILDARKQRAGAAAYKEKLPDDVKDGTRTPEEMTDPEKDVCNDARIAAESDFNLEIVELLRETCGNLAVHGDLFETKKRVFGPQTELNTRSEAFKALAAASRTGRDNKCPHITEMKNLRCDGGELSFVSFRQGVLDNVVMKEATLALADMTELHARNFKMLKCHAPNLNAAGADFSGRAKSFGVPTGPERIKSALLFLPRSLGVPFGWPSNGSKISGNFLRNSAFNDVRFGSAAFRDNDAQAVSFSGIQADSLDQTVFRMNRSMPVRFALAVVGLGTSSASAAGVLGRGQFGGTEWTFGQFDGKYGNAMAQASHSISKDIFSDRTYEESVKHFHSAGMSTVRPVGALKPLGVESGDEVWVGSNPADVSDPTNPLNLGRIFVDADREKRRTALAISYIEGGGGNYAKVIPAVYDDATGEWAPDQRSPILKELPRDGRVSLYEAERIAYDFEVRGRYDFAEWQEAQAKAA